MPKCLKMRSTILFCCVQSFTSIRNQFLSSSSRILVQKLFVIFSYFLRKFRARFYAKCTASELKVQQREYIHINTAKSIAKKIK